MAADVQMKIPLFDRYYFVLKGPEEVLKNNKTIIDDVKKVAKIVFMLLSTDPYREETNTALAENLLMIKCASYGLKFDSFWISSSKFL